MRLRKKSDPPPYALTNDSTNSPPASPTLDSPQAQEDSKDVLPTNGEMVPLMPEFIADIPKNQRQFGCLGWVIIFLVLGIGTLLLLPSLISCGPSIKRAEAKQNVATMNRSQQAYFLDKKAFSNSFESLSIGIPTQTKKYEYSIRTTKTAAFSYGISRKGTNNIKSYVGGVFLLPTTNPDPKADKDEMTTVGILCEATSPGNTRPADPIIQKGVPTCGSDTKELGR